MNKLSIKRYLVTFLAVLLISGPCVTLTWGEVSLDDIEIQINKVKRRGDGKDSNDDKMHSLVFKVIVENESMKEDLKDLKVEMIYFGLCHRDKLKSKVFKVLGKHILEFDVKKSSELELETDPIEIHYDDTRPVLWGESYYAYAAVARDSSGKKVLTKTDKSSFIKNCEAAMDFETGDYLDQSLNKVKKKKNF
ncbi:MAG: hypothetical protein AAGA18_10255 [Verrucomicrobiota bacterium]